MIGYSVLSKAVMFEALCTFLWRERSVSAYGFYVSSLGFDYEFVMLCVKLFWQNICLKMVTYFDL